jgi:hypothetical protein
VKINKNNRLFEYTSTLRTIDRFKKAQEYNI